LKISNIRNLNNKITLKLKKKIFYNNKIKIFKIFIIIIIIIIIILTKLKIKKITK